MQIALSAIELELLMKPVRGQGGWQRLLRKLQSQTAGNTLTLEVTDVSRIVRYRERYGSGGWQGRLGFLKRHRLAA